MATAWRQTKINHDEQAQPCFMGLTPTQWRVAKGVKAGLLNKQIAFNLGIAEATVKAHMTIVMRKLRVQNRTQVALAVIANEFAG